MTPTQYDLNFSLRRAQALIDELERRVADAEAEAVVLRSIIRAHRTARMNIGHIYGSDERLWDAAGLPPYIAPDIKGDM